MPKELESSDRTTASATPETTASEALLAEAASLLGGMGARLASTIRQASEDVVDHFKLHPERAIPELLLSPDLLLIDAATADDLNRR